VSNEPRRPPHRNKKLTIAFDDEVYDQAVEKAGSLARLRAIFRLFANLWGSNEWPPEMDFQDSDIEEEMRRAKKVPRKKKRR